MNIDKERGKKMARKVPNDTASFHYSNVNPKGKHVGDCAVRAIAGATGKSWDEVYDGLCAEGRKRKAMPNNPEVYSAYLKKLGWVKMKQPKHLDGTKYTGAEFARKYDYESVFLHIGYHHATCIVDGKVNDIWDCSDRCVGNYWVKK